MSDGPDWNAPASPGEGTPAAPTPVTGVDPRPSPLPLTSPAPLPLPPGAAKSARSGRKLVAGIVVAVVLVFLLLCGCAIFGLSSFDPLSNLGVDGVQTAHWAGDGRYAVVEYRGGDEATTSVVSWDSRTNRTHKVDGFRFVAVEPGSATVWVTRAASEDEYPAPSADGSDETVYDSGWEEPGYGEPLWDGPGAIWAWDAAKGGVPVQKIRPDWTPWEGPAGLTAYLGVDEATGLWPSRLSFSRRAAAIEAHVPFDMGTFLPVGWSPSGEYFAVRAGDMYAGVPAVAIFSATTGALVASYSVDLEALDDDSELTGFVDGAVWDATEDMLWVFQSAYGGNDDSTYRIEAMTVDPQGATTPLVEVPDEWLSATNTSVVLGRDSQGVLVAVDSSDGLAVWRVRAQGAERVFDTDSGRIEFFAGAYSEKIGLLARMETGDFLGAPIDSKAITVDMRGKSLRDVWPLGQ